MLLAPIVIFAYNRPWHLRQTLEALKANDLSSESILYIFCDGPKESASPAENENIQEVRRVAKETNCCKSVTVFESDKNQGLARSIIAGVTKIVNEYSKIIVIEDDVITSPHFLTYMNKALSFYEDKEDVLSIGSWNYFAHPFGKNFFIRYPDSIAWATWKRSWSLFEENSELAYIKLKEKGLLEKFNGVNYPYYEDMLKAQMEGKISSWAIRWTATSVIHGKKNLYPSLSLSKHIGFGENATHEKESQDYNSHIVFSDKHEMDLNFPESTEEDVNALQIWKVFVETNFLASKNLGKKKIKDRLRDILKAIQPKKKTGTFEDKILSSLPVSRVFGFDRGTPIDRYFIEDFLSKNIALIKGSVLEVAEDTYTKKFGKNVSQSLILSYEKREGDRFVQIDLSSDSVPQNLVDCFICTQTLNFIYDVKRAMHSIYSVLKPGGTVLLTVAGISQISRYDDDRWGDYWRFTPTGLKTLAREVFGEENIQIKTYGNSGSASLFLNGVSLEEVDPELLKVIDEDYPIIITLIASKK